MSYYDELKDRNIIRLLQGMLKAGALTLRGSDNKFVPNVRVEWDTPWVFTKPSYKVNCFLWKDVTFHAIVETQLPAQDRFVPLGCQECFKVVVRPQSLSQLFELEKIQERLAHPSKCGIEIRPSVFGNYGGYFYNRGLEEGLTCWDKVRKAVDVAMGSDVPVILKRGCTEMEHGVGRSDEWKMKPNQIQFESRLSQLYVNDIPVLQQSDHAKDEVRQSWIEHAYSVGDDTVFEYTEGKPLYPAYVEYQHLYNNKKEDV